MKKVQIALGMIALALGVIGIFLPLLPTTPFLLLAASLFFRSSPKYYHWLLQHKYLGPYIRQFREEKAIPLKGKIISISLIWITLGYCTLTISSIWWVRLFFILLAIGVTYHICSYKTLQKKNL
ncbi:MAG: YbaN family protein [Phocaeicola sp.]